MVSQVSFDSFRGWSGDYAVNTRGLLFTVDRKRAETRGGRGCFNAVDGVRFQFKMDSTRGDPPHRTP